MEFKKIFFLCFCGKEDVYCVSERGLLVKAISHILSLTYHMISYHFFI